MSELIVLAFPDAHGAAAMSQELHSLQKQHLVNLADAAIVTLNPDGKPRVRQLNNLVGVGVLGGAFWGMLIGLLFLNPWLGLAIGAVTGAVAGKFADVGIDDTFIKQVGATIKPGQSALFLMVEDWDEYKVLPEMAKHNAEILRTNLSSEDEARLKAAFGADDEND